MPATDETWRNQRLLHIVFAISGLALLGSTTWMMAADHWRPWKVYQRTGKRADSLLTGWRENQFQTEQAISANEKRDTALLDAQLTPPPKHLLDQFQATVRDYETVDGDLPNKDVDFRSIDETFLALTNQSELLSKRKSSAATSGDGEADANGDPDRQEEEAREWSKKAIKEALNIRERLVTELQEIVDDVKNHEDRSLQERKFQAANFDAAKANLGLGHRDSRDPGELKRLQAEVDRQVSELASLNAVYENLSDYRKELGTIIREMSAPIDQAQTEFDVSRLELERLEKAVAERTSTFFTGSFPFLGKRWLELPVLDAFNSPLAIDQIWLPELTQENGSFRRVARFDRCISCHQSMEQAHPQNPNKPAFLAEREIKLTITAPSDRFLEQDDNDDQHDPATVLRQKYGIWLAPAGSGLIHGDDVVVSFVRPESRAAVAQALGDRPPNESGLALRLSLANINAHTSSQPDHGLQVGDVLVSINGAPIYSNEDVYRYLLYTFKPGQPLNLEIRRGLPHPYTSHPRLDLFVGPSSPHPLQKIGCTSCHEGQGSGTAFTWASHTPNGMLQRREWIREYGWFNNHHWVFPMYPKRFNEASCLKCHHDVVQLEPSDRFPDDPAPKLVAGVKLIQTYGCYGCHEINGYDGPDTRIGPDVRVEPNYFAGALQLTNELRGRAGSYRAAAANLERQVADFRDKIEQLQKHMSAGEGDAEQLQREFDSLERQISPRAAQLEEYDMGEQDLLEMQQLAARISSNPDGEQMARERLIELIQRDEDRSHDDPSGALLPVGSHTLTRVLKTVEVPGRHRKVGPSLRYVAQKLDAAFLYDWLREPKHFRPDTKMPQFFGLWKHLPSGSKDRAMAEKFEPVEILGIVQYLLKNSQPYEPIGPADQISDSSEEQKIDRGKLLFELRGCLACHSHDGFPQAHTNHSDQLIGHLVHGPDLSRVGDKLAVERNQHGPDWLYSWLRNPSNYHRRTRMPNVQLEPIKHDDGTVTDPARDIAAYLLSVRTGWAPSDPILKLDEAGRHALDELALERLSATFTKRKAQHYLESGEGIPADVGAQLKGPERELVGSADERHKLQYIGAKSIAKYGCYGCHDIPGFEDSKPIGTSLADWGRKDPSKLDFAHILHYLQGHSSHAHGATHGGSHRKDDHANVDDSSALDPYFIQEIMQHGRAGFAMQKLREPRSYDADVTTNKGYDERLRMPQFRLNNEQREAIVTVLLGLVAEPPSPQYVYNPNPRQKAIVEGRQVLDKYNCGGCHMLEAPEWKLAYSKDLFPTPNVPADYPFLQSYFNAEQSETSKQTDHRNLLHASLRGLPTINDADGLPYVLDEEGDEVEEEVLYNQSDVSFRFNLWQPTLLNGHAHTVGGVVLEIPASAIEKQYPARGGSLAQLLLPRAVELERAVNPNAKGTEARGWLPPPLIGEGRKVQANWLHDFLLDPYPIRPAVLLRMPKFNMSSDEATRLVNYFAAVDQAIYPYEFTSRTRRDHLASEEVGFREKLQELGDVDIPVGNARFEHAMQIVTSKDFCIQCHRVGDFEPQGLDRAKAPDLANVYKRLRADFVRNWVANPKAILPYTSMPVNIAYVDPDPKLQSLYPGTNIQQVNALVDLLMNFDRYTGAYRKIKNLVKEEPPSATAATDAPDNSTTE